MKFKVYHTKRWAINANLHFSTEGYVPDKNDYELVAVCDCDDFGETFFLTNHIDDPWWENKEVALVKESRSTSVGDVVEDEKGKLRLVAGIGWENVEWKKEVKEFIAEKIMVLDWHCNENTGIGIKHSTEFTYSKDQRNEIVDLALDNGLDVMIRQLGKSLVIWINKGKFTQS